MFEETCRTMRFLKKKKSEADKVDIIPKFPDLHVNSFMEKEFQTNHVKIFEGIFRKSTTWIWKSLIKHRSRNCLNCLEKLPWPRFDIIIKSLKKNKLSKLSLNRCVKCPYSEFFWSFFSCIRSEWGEIWGISPCSIRMWEKRIRKIPNIDNFHVVLV